MAPTGADPIRPRRGGDRIILTGLAADSAQPIRADRDPNKPDRYVGRLRFNLDGIDANFRFTLDLESTTRIRGRLVAKTTVSGKQCTIRRPFELAYAP
jgi:hypothetical protein